MPRTVLQIPSPTDEAQRPPVVFDADLDDHDNTVFAVGIDKATTHLLFSGGALVRLPKPLHSCRVRLFDRDGAFVWGWVRPRGEEPNAWIIQRDGSTREPPGALQYATTSCADVLCTDDFIVTTFYEDVIDFRHGPICAEGVAILDRNGAFLWGWNSTILEAASVADCDAAVRLGGNLIAVFASAHFPIVVLDLTTRRPAAIYHPTPDVLHGAQAISMRDGTWYFVTPYQAKEAVLSWRPECGKPEIHDNMPARHRFRGLRGGRFIDVTPEAVGILTLR
jgi:hypothetical protein